MANTKITTNVIADGAITSAKLDTNITISGNITGTLATAAQPNITSVGSLTGLDVNGTITSYGLNFDISDGVEINALESIVFDIDSDNNQTGRVFQVKANNSTALMTITETGSVGIGDTSPDRKLHVNSGNDNECVLFESTDTEVTIELKDTTGTAAIKSRNDFRFTAGGSERMRIDTSGNVGIGNTNPSGMSSNASKLVVGTGSGNQGMSIYAGTSIGRYAFARAVGDNTDAYDGGMAYDGSRNLTFHTNANSERFRIDGSGNVLLGNTVVNPASGFASQKGFGYAASTGKVEIATDANAAVMELGKNNSNNGSILVFRKQGTVVGSISTFDGEVSFGRSSVGIMPVGSSTAPRVIPTNHDSNVIRDAAIDLGYSNARFKDLYLSGGVHLGGTGSANKLDDYEEGTWTPTINSGTMSSGATGTYTKVGRLVTVTYYILLTTMGGSTTPVQVGGLPFTSGISGNTGSHSAGSLLCRYFTKNQIVSYVPAGVTYIAFYNNSSSNWDQITFGELEATHDNDFEAHGTLQYIV